MSSLKTRLISGTALVVLFAPLSAMAQSTFNFDFTVGNYSADSGASGNGLYTGAVGDLVVTAPTAGGVATGVSGTFDGYTVTGLGSVHRTGSDIR